ncbi:MAG: hypothetical protein HC906_18830 [Bacteroidales bacterium]|nr:hypothetical protein [Bacteroidales bacterium]
MKNLKWMYALMIAGAIFTSCEKDKDEPKETTVNGGNVSGVWEKIQRLRLLAIW